MKWIHILWLRNEKQVFFHASKWSGGEKCFGIMEEFNKCWLHFFSGRIDTLSLSNKIMHNFDGKQWTLISQDFSRSEVREQLTWRDLAKSLSHGVAISWKRDRCLVYPLPNRLMHLPNKSHLGGWREACGSLPGGPLMGLWVSSWRAWQVAPSRDGFVLQETFGSVWRPFCLLQPEQEFYKHLEVEVGNTARHPSGSGIVVHNKELFSQNVSGAKIEETIPQSNWSKKEGSRGYSVFYDLAPGVKLSFLQ